MTTSAIEKAVNDTYAVVIYRNKLNTTTVALLTSEEWADIQTGVDKVPEDRIVDTNETLTPETVDAAVARVFRKLNREGEYHDWDARMAKFYSEEEA